MLAAMSVHKTWYKTVCLLPYPLYLWPLTGCPVAKWQSHCKRSQLHYHRSSSSIFIELIDNCLNVFCSSADRVCGNCTQSWSDGTTLNCQSCTTVTDCQQVYCTNGTVQWCKECNNGTFPNLCVGQCPNPDNATKADWENAPNCFCQACTACESTCFLFSAHTVALCCVASFRSSRHIFTQRQLHR